MTFKRLIFWAHLSVGVGAGLVIFLLSLSGVVLTYERQVIAFSERQFYVDIESTQRLSVDDILISAKKNVPGDRQFSIVISKNPRAPIIVRIGRSSKIYLDPNTGDVLAVGATNIEEIFGWVTAFHRWFALESRGRELGKQITGAANLAFLFLIISGVYIWLPKIWRSQVLKNKLFFRRSYPTGKSRDFNWHNVIGLWSALPLIIVVSTAVVFSYSWANALVFRAFGEEPPSRGGPPTSASAPINEDTPVAESAISLDELLVSAQSYERRWRRISIPSNSPAAAVVEFDVDWGSGREPFKKVTLTYSRSTGSLLKVGGISERTPGSQTRTFIRFLHTGESLGIIGQTIAGIVSLGACLLTYTGFALAYRRLIRPHLLK